MFTLYQFLTITLYKPSHHPIVYKILKLLSRYAVLLLLYVDNKNLAVVDLVKREIVGGATVSHSRASTSDFSQVLYV